MNTAGKVLLEGRRNLKSQGGFTDSPWPRECQELGLRLTNQIGKLRHLSLTTNERWGGQGEPR